VVCVSSGAVASGLHELGLSARPNDLPGLQAAAAVGQARLVEVYRRYFTDHGIAAAQVLLTHADLRSRERHLNARNTLTRLLRDGVVPVVNENDTVAVDEIRVGDNDTLAALVSVLLRADALVMLTTTDGLRARADDAGTLMTTVPRITPETFAAAGGTRSGLGTGGMRTKVEAADIVTRCGECAIIADASEPDVLARVLGGEAIGTFFAAREDRLAGRKRWIAFFDRPRGALHLDAGATVAVRDQGRSLLAAGIRAVDGAFASGDPVRILGDCGNEIARGLVAYPASELQRIHGCTSAEIAEILGRADAGEVVHRDDLVLS
jgi:glutamate 5-kinase